MTSSEIARMALGSKARAPCECAVTPRIPGRVIAALDNMLAMSLPWELRESNVPCRIKKPDVRLQQSSSSEHGHCKRMCL